MTIRPILTEKSLALAKDGQYSFWVPKTLTKYGIKQVVGETFGVTVTGVTTLRTKRYARRNVYGKSKTTASQKKAIVTLKEGEKIALFGEEEKKS